jgi:hypothetical protein
MNRLGISALSPARARSATQSIAFGLAASFTVAVLVLSPSFARAFCGFYVSGADASLYNNATVVALMREGTRTALSMQNNYEGPPENFAMVVPVPVVLQEENVKTLPDKIFARLDQLAAPRLVEYWEQDPCYRPRPVYRGGARARSMAPSMADAESAAPEDLGVTVEAEFKVGEYDIVILSANDSAGLDTWLRQENYNIPDGAEPVLRPYVQQGTKFFVAKVDVEKVKFAGGKAVLSPLRFHYDSDDFALPVRLGLLNSAGKQDLIVHILARGQRYEVANYDNVTIPTNTRVENGVREHFGGFYEKLFSRTVEQNPGAVVTEYSWDASTCDPCPTPAMRPAELTTLGADVMPGGRPSGFVLTRLHYRYGKDELGEDLIFRAAPPIAGGRGTPDQWGRLLSGTQPSGRNQFQGRYAILHEWEGEITCDNPQRGRWGGPPGQGPRPVPTPMPEPRAAPSPLRQSAPPSELAAKTPALGTLVAEDIPAIGIRAGKVEQSVKANQGDKAPTESETGGAGVPPAAAGKNGGCAGCSVGASGGSALGGLGAVAIAMLLVRRRWRR